MAGGLQDGLTGGRRRGGNGAERALRRPWGSLLPHVAQPHRTAAAACTAPVSAAAAAAAAAAAQGKNCVVLGDSNIVGTPLAAMLRDKGAAAVTICHRRSYREWFEDQQVRRRAGGRAGAGAGA